MANHSKSFLICLLAFVSCTKLGSAGPMRAEAEITKLVTMAEKCRMTVGATGDDLKDLIRDQEPKTKEAKCLHACVTMELKLVDKNGQYDRAGFMVYAKTFSDRKEFLDIAMKIFDNCYTKKNYVVTMQQCDDAAEFRTCMQKEGDIVFNSIDILKKS